MTLRSRKRIRTEEYNDSDFDTDMFDLKRTDKETYNKFIEVQNEIKKTDLDILTILHSDMDISDKSELFQLYELYKTLPLSEESISLKKKIYGKFEKGVMNNKYNKQFRQEISALEKHTDEKEVRSSILELNTTQENKRVIYSVYKRLENLPETSEEYYKLKDWVNYALSLP